jgi:hypothetical protein
METVVGVALAAILLVAAALKLIAPTSRVGLAVFGVRGERSLWLFWSLAIVSELLLAGLLVLGTDLAFLLAAGLFGGYALAHWRAIRRGAVGQSCGCFGSRGVVSWGGVLRNGALACFALVGFAAAEFEPSDRALAICGFAVLTLAVVALSAAVAALAREVGILRLAMQSGGALEIPEEGPALGAKLAIERWFDDPQLDLALAVFISPDCPICRNLGPSLDFIDRDPGVTVATFDEERDHAAWDEFRAPGAPYAVALSAAGEVLAKGVANSLPHLESIVATAARRRAESAHA